jgi:formylglycine-generating enzyme required for sulfatase activity
MRRGSTSLLLLFLAMLSAQLVSQQEPRAADVKELPQASERWALLVGVEDYTDRNISPLRGPANDVKKMRDTLVKYAAFPSDNIIVLSTKGRDADMPTRTGILTALSKIRNSIASNGLLLFMFSGHGISRGEKAFLLPSNATLTDDADLLEDTSLSVDLLRERMAATKVKQIIMFLDACRNDPEKSKAASGNNPLSEHFTKALDFARRNKEVEASAVIYATGLGERAYINNSDELGYFTEAITKAMGGAVADKSGQITLGALVEYIQSNVPKWVTRDYNKNQKPFSVIAGYRAEKLVVSAIPAPPPSAVAVPGTVSAIRPVEPLKRTFANNIGMSFVLIPAGSFTMGSPTDEPGRHSPERQHPVTISKPFYLQSTEVSRRQWTQVMGSDPSKFKDCGDDCPVDNVSWNDAQEFIRRLNQMSGENYRLPNEAEWEYAAKSGGKTEKYAGTSNDSELGDYAWFIDNSRGTTHPVGKKRANGLGLYDMSGNVYEWCQDWWGDYPTTQVTDPTGPKAGKYPVIRGGCWGNDAHNMRTAGRLRDSVDSRSKDIGFRVARDP